MGKVARPRIVTYEVFASGDLLAEVALWADARRAVHAPLPGRRRAHR